MLRLKFLALESIRAINYLSACKCAEFLLKSIFSHCVCSKMGRDAFWGSALTVSLFLCSILLHSKPSTPSASLPLFCLSHCCLCWAVRKSNPLKSGSVVSILEESLLTRFMWPEPVPQDVWKKYCWLCSSAGVWHRWHPSFSFLFVLKQQFLPLHPATSRCRWTEASSHHLHLRAHQLVSVLIKESQLSLWTHQSSLALCDAAAIHPSPASSLRAGCAEMVGWEVAVPALHAVQRGCSPQAFRPSRQDPKISSFSLVSVVSECLRWASCLCCWRSSLLRCHFGSSFASATDTTGSIISQVSNGVSLIN